MPENDDIGFTFNYNPFIEGIKKVTENLMTMGKVALSVATASSGAFGMVAGAIGGKLLDTIKKTHGEVDAGKNTVNSLGTWAIAKGNLIANAITSLVRKAWGEFKAGLPELDRTFSIAKEIILRNLFWPIRQVIAPYLQKVLNWVRDNRGLFVRIGSTLVNVFQIVKTSIQTMYAVVKSLWDTFARKVEGFIAPIKKSWDEIINMIMFKTTAVILFIGQIIESAAGFIGNVIGQVVVMVKSFFDGLVQVITENMGVIDEAIDDIIQAFNEIIKIFNLSNEEMKTMAQIAQTIGKVFGGALVIGIKAFATSVMIAVDAVKALVLAMKALGQASIGDFKGAWETLKKIGDIGSHSIGVIKEQAVETYEVGKKVGGQIIQDINNAKKTNINASQNVKIDKIEIHTKATDAKGISKDIGESVNEQLKKALRTNMAIQGGF